MLKKYFKKPLFDDVLLFVSAGLVAAASIYIGKKEAFFNALNGDVLVFNNLFHDPFKWGDLYILSEHAFVIKYPIFALENLVGFNITTHVVFSVLTILFMNIGVCWLIYRFTDKNKRLTSLFFLLIAAITLFSVTQNYFWGYSPLAIRNIEIPLTVLAIVGLFKQKKIISVTTILLISLLALLYLSDKMVLAFILGATTLYFIVEVVLRKKLSAVKHVFYEDRVFYVAILSSVVLAVAVESLVRLTQIVLLTATTPMRTTNSVAVLFESVPKFISGIINLFGANFFDKTIPQALPNLLLMVVVAAVVCIVIRLAFNYTSIKEKHVRYLLFVICANVLVFFLLHQTSTDRYLAFMPFIFLLLAAYALRKTKVTLPKNTLGQLGLLLTVVIVFGALGLYSKQQRAVMTTKNYNSIASPLSQSRDLSSVLRDNNVDLLIGNYWLIHPAKFWYDQKFDHDLTIVSAVPLSENKVGFGRFISRESWLTKPVSSDSNSAYAIRDFDYGENVDIDTAAKQTFGEYTKKIRYDEGGINLYIYSNDIRPKLTTSE